MAINRTLCLLYNYEGTDNKQHFGGKFHGKHCFIDKDNSCLYAPILINVEQVCSKPCLVRGDVVTHTEPWTLELFREFISHLNCSSVTAYLGSWHANTMTFPNILRVESTDGMFYACVVNGEIYCDCMFWSQKGSDGFVYAADQYDFAKMLNSDTSIDELALRFMGMFRNFYECKALLLFDGNYITRIDDKTVWIPCSETQNTKTPITKEKLLSKLVALKAFPILYSDIKASLVKINVPVTLDQTYSVILHNSNRIDHSNDSIVDESVEQMKSYVKQLVKKYGLTGATTPYVNKLTVKSIIEDYKMLQCAVIEVEH